MFIYNIMKHSPGLFVCVTMEDVPGGDSLAGESGEGEVMGEPDDDHGV